MVKNMTGFHSENCPGGGGNTNMGGASFFNGQYRIFLGGG